MNPLEEVILANSTHRLAKLYAPAKKAYEAPANGIIITVPAAAAVIQDCALVTINYLPLMVFGFYGNPFNELKGKITHDQIKEFVNRASTSIAAMHLLRVILAKGANIETARPVIEEMTASNPYGDYESANQQQLHDNVYILSKLFGVV